ncbi:MAG: Rpn family recombination-promoting nuclease/putative transposase [Thermosynechococcaceae cyanobacterium MS004]|nr:Rpn family recombination-promoting nuclease/putative transposase [Thermosynechococcaceae cyanobacterium MS004]
MKTDSIFYRIFQTAPEVFFELLGEPAEYAQGYVFRSVEVKQLAFRIDGVFLPQSNAPDRRVWFVEVQYQKDPLFYHRFFAEIFLYFQQYPDTADWKAVVLFSKRSVEPEQTQLFRTLLESTQVQRVYLEDLQNESTESLGLGLLQLIDAKPETAGVKALALVEKVRGQVREDADRERIIELIETVMVYKFPLLSREEIEQMFGLSELKQTRVYQEALEEGREEGRRQEALEIMLRFLRRRLGVLESTVETQIELLSLVQLEALGEALLDFGDESDLLNWLREHAQTSL